VSTPAPPLTHTVERESGPYDIKMTYGLEMDLRRLLPDPGTAMQLAMTDVFTQDYLVRRCLTKSAKMIRNDEDLIPVEDVDISTDDADALIMWVLEHQLYFFTKRARGVSELAARQKAELQQSRSTIGSEPSPSTTPSAGPSDVSKETLTT
jgi:hypothetical protein